MPFRDIAQGVLDVDKTYDVVQIFDVNRIAGVVILNHLLHRLLHGTFSVNRDNVGPMLHNILDVLVRKGKDIANHRHLAGGQNSLLMSLPDLGDQILLKFVLA